MLELLRDLVTWVLLLGGSFFLVVGAIGLNRMPDLYSRLQATGISDTVGAGLILVGLIVQAGFSLVSVKLLFLLLVFLFTTPVATHAVTRAAMSVGVAPKLFDERGTERREVLESLELAEPVRDFELDEAATAETPVETASVTRGGASSKP